MTEVRVKRAFTTSELRM